MVKVFLEESAELCMERLDTLIKEENSYRIVCPNETFIEKLVAFYPHLESKNLWTVSQLISELGFRPIPCEIANVFSLYSSFLDPTIHWMNGAKALSESEQKLAKNWLKNTGFVDWEDFSKDSANFCKMCIFFGPFNPGLLSELRSYWGPLFEKFFAIRRTFKLERNVQLTQIKGYSVRNIQQEREYIRNISEKNTNFIACHPESWLETFPSKNDHRHLRWLDYQEEGTLGYFLPYLYASNEDKDSRDANIKKLKNAQKYSHRDDLFSLKNWLSQQNETETLPLTRLNWPSKGTLGDFVQLLNACDNSWNLPKTLEYCPIEFSRRQFFAYLRSNAKHCTVKHLIPWEEALYLPIKNGCLLHGVSEDSESNTQRLSWFKEIISRGGSLTVVVPELDEKGMPYKPLIPNVVRIEETAQKIDSSDSPKQFILPKDRLKFSCKNWERFHLSPVRTWLDVILKAKKFDLIQPNTKARICGEWVHENLEFTTQPKDLEAWKASIIEKAGKRWQVLEKIFAEKMPIQFQQWHTRTYHLSLQIAQVCSDLLDGSWTLQSEYVLPKNAENSGRIDLLATRSQEAVIVDFKTAVDYAFTPGQLNKGHGLQLLLYGRALEPYYERIQLRVINGNCANLTLDLHEISPEVRTIEAWLATIKRTGIYNDLPEEKRSTLPLCWR